MGDGWGPARLDACGQASSRDGRPRQGLTLAVLAVAAAAWMTAGPGHGQGLEGNLQLHLVQGSGTEALQITVAPSIAATSAAQAPLAIGIGPAGGLPKNSFVRVRGLPPTVSLSEGYVTAPGACRCRSTRSPPCR